MHGFCDINHNSRRGKKMKNCKNKLANFAKFVCLHRCKYTWKTTSPPKNQWRRYYLETINIKTKKESYTRAIKNNPSTIHRSCCKFFIYRIALITKFIAIQHLQQHTYKHNLYGKQKQNKIAILIALLDYQFHVMRF